MINPKWFFAESNEKVIYVTNAKQNEPSSSIKNKRRLTYEEFLRIYPYYVKRCNGVSVSQDAAKETYNRVYWYGIFNDILDKSDLNTTNVSKTESELPSN